MGLLSLFGKGPLSQAKIDKTAKLASNPFAQPDVRMREMQRLFEDGSPAALRGVLRRFAANASGSIADEDEKKWLEDELVEQGDTVREPLQSYIRAEKQLTYALRAYRRLTGDREAVRFFIEVLEAYGPDDHRSVEAKQQLILQLSELLTDERVMPALTPFLVDHSDEVRWAVMELIEVAAKNGQLLPAQQASVAELLGRLVTEPEVGPRIQQRAAEMLANHEWPMPGEAEALAGPLDEQYFVDKKRFVRRRAKKREA